MTVVRQNILSSVMIKIDKLSYGNVKFHLATPEIFKARNLCSYARNNIKKKKEQKSGERNDPSMIVFSKLTTS